MDRELPLVPTIIFLASIVFCIGLYMQRISAFSIPVVGQMFYQSGSLHALFGNQVLDLKQDRVRLSLDELNIDRHVGQLGVDHNGNLFVNKGGQSTSLIHKWKRFNRQKDSEPNGSEGSLLNCDSLNSCQPWGDASLSFDTAWSMFNTGDGQYLIADTARHRMHLVAPSGNVLHTLEGFNFPNHVFQYQESDWVVNTNGNNLIELTINGGALARTGNTISLRGYAGVPDDYKFPSMAFSTHVDGESSLVVLTHPNGMNRGKIFQLRGESASPLLAQLNDISTIELHENILYAADYETHALWSTNLITGETSRLDRNAFDHALQNSKTVADREFKYFIAYASIIMTVGFLALFHSLFKSKPAVDR